MDDLTSPALLGCILIYVALSAWTLGRWQSRAGPAHQALCATPESFGAPGGPGARRPLAALNVRGAALAPRPAPTERQGAMSQIVSLTDLHAEVSAYRQREQIFAALADHAIPFERSWLQPRTLGREMDVNALPGTAKDCDCEAALPNAANFAPPAPSPSAPAAPQPWLDVSPFTRV